MTVYVVTGKLGAGKTLVAVGRIRDYLFQERKIATNLDLNLNYLIGVKSKNANVLRLPDVPSLDNLESIGLGYDGEYQGEEKNGLLVLDECGSFLNARDFNDKNRKGLLDWVIHARKRRWDVVFIIQHLEALDKQFRLMFAEHTVFCMRFDRIPIPIFGFLIRIITGYRLMMPKMHRGLVKYGSGQQAITVDTWWYRGTTLYDAYNTEQSFNPYSEQSIYSIIPPYYTHGRYTNDWQELKKTAKRYFKKIKITETQSFFFGVILGAIGLAYAGEPVQSESVPANNAAITTNGSTRTQAKPEDYFLTGFLDIGGQVTYSIEDTNGNNYYPQNDGYRLKSVNRCKLMLIKNKKATYIKCPTSDVDFMSASDVGALLNEEKTDVQ